MATRAVTDEQLQSIADAIKLKSGDDTPMSVDDMALRIELIEGGGNIARRTVIADAELSKGYTAGFFNKFMYPAPSTNGIRFALIKNTITSGNYGVFAATFFYNGMKRDIWQRSSGNSGNQVNTSYEYFVGEGSEIDIYDFTL